MQPTGRRGWPPVRKQSRMFQAVYANVYGFTPAQSIDYRR